MNVSWEQIVDVARGVASEAVRLAVEADPEAMAKVRLLQRVDMAARQEAPESFVNRAKALNPVLPNPRPSWIGKLVYASTPFAQGMRSAGAVARDLRYAFEDGSVELRIEPIANSSRAMVVGLFASAHPAQVRVSAGPRASAWCDEIGQFELEIPADLEILSFHDAVTGESYEVNLK